MEFKEMVFNLSKMSALVVGLALALSACAAEPPSARYVPASYGPQVDTWDGVYRPAATYRQAAPPVVQHTPERPFEPEPVPAPDEQPVDPSCGWWRLCNLWSGS
jgi:hypothetical protein